MPSNDTENIYATQFGGEGEPIPATKISYDGTGTSIEATNVQNAITEIDTDLQSTKEDVTDIKEVLRSGYMLVETNKRISVTADGVKTLGALMTELGAACLTAIQALTDKEILAPTNFSDGSKDIDALSHGRYTNSSASFNPRFQRIESTSSKTTMYYAMVKATGTSESIKTELITTPTITFTDEGQTVPTNGTNIYIAFDRFEKA